MNKIEKMLDLLSQAHAFVNWGGNRELEDEIGLFLETNKNKDFVIPPEDEDVKFWQDKYILERKRTLRLQNEIQEIYAEQDKLLKQINREIKS